MCCTDGVSWISASVHSSLPGSATAGPAGAAVVLGAADGVSVASPDGAAPICGRSSDGVGLGALDPAALRGPAAPEPLDPPQEYATSRMSSRSPPATRARRRQ